jgi:acetyltransferase
MSLASLFNPRSVLLIGSAKMQESGIMVTPEIFERVSANLKVFSGRYSVCDADDENFSACDLAVITLPPEKVLEILPRLKTKFVLILSGGFDDGQRKRLKAFASKFRILGPNSVCGLINTSNSLNTTFERELQIKSGKISVISQSGGIGAALLDYIVSDGVGLSKFVWIGNAADINECDVLEYLAKDPYTKVILLYLESIREPRRFMQLARHAPKPIIVLKAGASKEAKSRALTHTDSLSTDAELYTAAFRQAGIIEAESVRELLNCALLFERYKKRKIRRVAIVSNTGGSSIIAADCCHRLGLELASFSEETKKNIAEKYPRLKVINPLDIAADADGAKYKFILDLVVKDRNTDAVLIINQFKSCLVKPEELEALKRLKTGKIVLNCAPGEEDYKKAKFFLRDTFPMYGSVEDAVKVMKRAEEYGKWF